MTDLEKLLDQHQQHIEFLENKIDLLAEAMAQHASVIHILARQIRQMAHEMDTDIEPPPMN